MLTPERRWCRYVHLLFTKLAPVSYLDNIGHVRLLSVTLILKKPHGWQKPLTSLIVGGDGGQGKASASVGRYKDEYVEKLRQLGGTGEGVEGDITWGGVAGDGVYDSHKMFKVFAKLGSGELDAATSSALLPGEKVSLGLRRTRLTNRTSSTSTTSSPLPRRDRNRRTLS